MERLRILLVQKSLQPPGGSSAVPVAILQALSGRHDITVYSWTPVDLEAVNAYYGAKLRSSDATWTTLPPFVRLLDVVPVPLALLKTSILLRYAKRTIQDFDVVICADNETDFGPSTLQYIHHPARQRPRPAVDLRWYHRWKRALSLYYWLSDKIADFHPDRVAAATSVANSSWVAARMIQTYGASSAPRVLPPPVEMTPSPFAWEARQVGFVCIGRIAPEKELERIIRVLEQVHQRHPSVRLHIIGSRGPWRRYMRTVETAARRAGDWVQLHFDASRAELTRLIHENRYAIHGMSEEHFGIAPAEALLGGSIVFVPNGGGQVDIVGEEPRLRFDSDEDAVRKIVTLLENDAEQDAMRTYLAERRRLFGRARFEEAIRALVLDVHRKAQ